MTGADPFAIATVVSGTGMLAGLAVIGLKALHYHHDRAIQRRSDQSTSNLLNDVTDRELNTLENIETASKQGRLNPDHALEQLEAILRDEKVLAIYQRVNTVCREKTLSSIYNARALDGLLILKDKIRDTVTPIYDFWTQKKERG